MWIPTSEREIAGALNAGLDETLTLEVKRELPVKAKNVDVAIDVSAMANEAGGVIVYGISEDANKRLDALSPILSSLEPVKQHVSILSGMELQNAYPGTHATSNAAFLSAARAKHTESSDYFLGTTVDQIAAKQLGRQRRRRRRPGQVVLINAGVTIVALSRRLQHVHRQLERRQLRVAADLLRGDLIHGRAEIIIRTLRVLGAGGAE